MPNPASQAPLVKPDLAPRLYHGRLNSRMRNLQAQAQGLVLRTGEPLGGVRLQGRELPTILVRSRAIAWVTSFGSCGPT